MCMNSDPAILPSNRTSSGVDVQLQILALFLCSSIVPIGTHYLVHIMHSCICAPWTRSNLVVGIFFVHVSVLDCRISWTHQIMKNNTCFNDDGDCYGVVLHRSEEDLPTLSQDAERILNDTPTPWQSVIGKILWSFVIWRCALGFMRYVWNPNASSPRMKYGVGISSFGS